MPPLTPTHRLARIALLALVLQPLAGCEIPSLPQDPRVVQREAEAKAVGGACRHALRGLEDCFTLNPKAPKAQVFAGWKDMDLYMRENKIEGTASVLTQLEKKPASRRASDEEADLQTEDRTSRNRS